MGQYLSRVVTSAASILEGMAVTLSWLFRRPCTVQWPDKIEKPIEDTLSERYRGILEVETKTCTACQMCEKTCPIDCICITVERNAETKERFITGFDIDAAKCMYCGLCVEPCPTGAIQHTREFEGTMISVQNLTFRFVPDPLKPTPVYKVVKGADSISRKVLGEVVRAQLHTWDSPAPFPAKK